MGDMLRCNKCQTFHYRNDPCAETVLREQFVYCSQCLQDSTMEELHANEGYCRECCQENQKNLDQHNAEYDRWEILTDQQREAEIKRATN